jgi:hypothetical protein
MSQPATLRSLSREWREQVDPDHYQYGNRMLEQHAKQLDALLDVWDAELTKVDAEQSGSISIQSIKLRMLGKPEKERK